MGERDICGAWSVIPKVRSSLVESSKLCARQIASQTSHTDLERDMLSRPSHRTQKNARSPVCLPCCTYSLSVPMILLTTEFHHPPASLVNSYNYHPSSHTCDSKTSGQNRSRKPARDTPRTLLSLIPARSYQTVLRIRGLCCISQEP